MSVAEALRAGGGPALLDALRARLADGGQATALTAGRKCFTANRLRHLVEGVTARLFEEGMREGDVVLLAVRPGPEMLALMLACLRIGAVVTPIDRGAGPELFGRRLEVLRPRWVCAESLVYAAGGPLVGRLLRRFELPDLRRIPARHVVVGRGRWGVPAGAMRWSALREGGGAPLDEIPEPDAEAPGMIVFTSGTTGAPKGVRHSGRSAASAIGLILDHLDAPPGSVVSTQSVHSTVAALLAGAAVVVAPLSFRPGRWLAAATKHGVTHAFLRPWDAFRLTDYCRGAGRRLPDRVRRIYLYSAPVTPTLLTRLHELGHPGLRCASVYGMTEALPVSWVDSRERLAWRGGGDLVGRPLDGVSVRVGAAGTLEVRGANVHLGYLGDTPTEWHDSGDVARIDPDGAIVLLGRAKNMILRKSFNIYPGLYEETIGRISGVAECALVGVPDSESADERVVLFVAPEPGSFERDHAALARVVTRALREGHHRIDHAALPDDVVVLERLPRNRRRKIDRAALRQQAEAGGAEANGS